MSAVAEGSQPVECRTSRLKAVGLLGLTCLMVAVCYSCTTRPDLFARMVGWIGIAFFGLGFLAVPLRFFRGGPQVILNEEGIEDRRLGIGVIQWQDIRSLSIRWVNSVKFLCIEVDEPDKYLAKLPRWKQALARANEGFGLPPLTIDFIGLSPGLHRAWEYVQARTSVARKAGGQR